MEQTQAVHERSIPRLLCDEMLQRLCRWLRAAGYDTVQARFGAADREIISCAVAEDRLLLTRDREFLARREATTRVFYLTTDDLDGQAILLRDELAIDWLHRPFSRCLLCNTELERAPDSLRPPQVALPLLHCPHCHRLYWEGTHVRRMRARLRDWRES